MFFLILISFSLKLSYLPFSLVRCEFGSFACKNSAIKYFFGCSLCFISGSSGNIHEDEGVSDEVAFDEMIKWSLSGEAGGIIDFKKVEFVSIINHKIKSQDFKAHIIG